MLLTATLHGTAEVAPGSIALAAVQLAQTGRWTRGMVPLGLHHVVPQGAATAGTPQVATARIATGDRPLASSEFSKIAIV